MKPTDLDFFVTKHGRNGRVILMTPTVRVHCDADLDWLREARNKLDEVIAEIDRDDVRRLRFAQERLPPAYGFREQLERSVELDETAARR